MLCFLAEDVYCLTVHVNRCDAVVLSPPWSCADFYDVPQLQDGDAGPWQIVALVFMGLCLTLAAAGGVGGGPMLVSYHVRSVQDAHASLLQAGGIQLPQQLRISYRSRRHSMPPDML